MLSQLAKTTSLCHDFLQNMFWMTHAGCTCGYEQARMVVSRGCIQCSRTSMWLRECNIFTICMMSNVY